MMTRQDHRATVRRVLLITLILNLLVMALKATVGVLTGSLSLMADALHSVTDSANNILGLVASQFSSPYPDRNHPYGHQKFEAVGALGISAFLGIACFDILQGAIAGITLGLLQDGMTAANPTHTLSLALVGILTALIQKQRYIQEDFISVALIVFGMAVIAETVTAFQFMLQDLRVPDRLSSRTLSEIWNYHQQIALCSAILSSLWAPVLYYPLNRWWQRVSLADQLQT